MLCVLRIANSAHAAALFVVFRWKLPSSTRALQWSLKQAGFQMDIVLMLQRAASKAISSTST